MGTHPIFESDFDCLTDEMFARISLLGCSKRTLFLTVRLRNPYRILGVSPNASKKEVKSAHKKKVMECHPDFHPDDEKKRAEFIRVQEAYEAIMSGDATAPTGNATGSGRASYARGNFDSTKTSHGFNSQSNERPKQGFDFDHNYRKRMRARAEWERIQKERRARGHSAEHHAYQHHAKWSKDKQRPDDEFWEGDRTFRSDFERRQHFEQFGRKRHAFADESEEQRYQRARRVQENLHKAYKFEQGTEHAWSRTRHNNKHAQERYDTYEANFKKQRELEKEQQRQIMVFSAFLFSGFIVVMAQQAYENLSRADRENEYRMERISRMQNYRTNLKEFNEHTQKHFAKLEQSRNAREPSIVIPNGTRPGLDPEMTAEQNRQILERLEHNSTVLGRMDSNAWGPR